MPFQRFYEAALIRKGFSSLNEIKSRTELEKGKPRPSLFVIPSNFEKPSFYK